MKTLRSVALAAVVSVALMAGLTTAAASAAPSWHINGSAIRGSATYKSKGFRLVISFKHWKLKIEWVEWTDPSMIEQLPEKAGTSKTTFTLEKPKGLESAEGCTIAAPTNLKLKGELVEEGGVVYQKFTPESGETLGTLVLSGCLLAGEYPLHGSIRAELLPHKGEAVNLETVFGKTTGSKLSSKEFEGEIEGADVATLTGANEGLKWGAF